MSHRRLSTKCFLCLAPLRVLDDFFGGEEVGSEGSVGGEGKSPPVPLLCRKCWTTRFA